MDSKFFFFIFCTEGFSPSISNYYYGAELRYCNIGAVPAVPMLKMGHVDS
jgi:hypothetical protein